MKKLYVALVLLLSGLLVISATALAARPGVISGVIRWQMSNSGLDVVRTADGRATFGYNFSGGKKDGKKSLKFQLIDRRLNMAELTGEEITDWYQNGTPPSGRSIFLGQTKEDGSYRLENVPPGEYFMVVLLPEARDAGLPSRDSKELREYLPEWDHFALSVVGIGGFDAFRVQIRPGTETKADYIYGAPMPVKVRYIGAGGK